MTNANDLTKRLNLVKQLILLEEFDQANYQLSKLQKSSDNTIFSELIVDIENKSFSDCIRKIELFLQANENLIVYEDAEIEALKIEIKRLEIEISSVSDDIADIEKIIHDFSLRHNKELGEILQKLLLYRKEHLEKEKDTDEQKKKAYEEAKTDYEHFNQQFEATKNEKTFDLTDEEQIELKKQYRKATKLCHPDIVADELKEQAEAVFNDLKLAYEQNNLARVTEILSMLEKGDMFVSKSDSIKVKSKLKAEALNLRAKLNHLTKTLKDLMQTETYHTIKSIDDLDQYFTKTKKVLQEELNYWESR